MCNPKPGPRCDSHVLDRLIDKLGFSRGYLDDAYVETRCELLVTRGGLKALAQQIAECPDDNPKKAKLLAAYKTGYLNYVNRMALIGKTPRAIPLHPEGLDTVEPQQDVRKLQQIAYGLYAKKDSPLHAKARLIEKRYTSTITGYVPGQPHTSTLDTAALARSMNADLSAVPDNAVAVDIECDTTNGFGLQPHRAQITEMVICAKDKTIVLAGDERHILQRFADYMNSRSTAIEVDGWNTSGFDLPFLQVRASYHAENLQGWNMELRDAQLSSGYAPVGGYENNQSMSWTTPSGHVHQDKDIFVEIKNSAIDTQGMFRLKGLAKQWGMNPVELDRENLHSYSQEEREAYVASDGIATLFTYGQYLQRSSHS